MPRRSRPEATRTALLVAAASFVAAFAAANAPARPLLPNAKPRPPANVSPPVVSGPAQSGQTLLAGPGAWSGAAPIAYAFQWRRCDASGAGCVSVAGATAVQYLLGSADVGSTVRVVVTASNRTGRASATSAATALVSSQPLPTHEYFGTLPVGTALPRTDADCAGRVTRSAWEPVPANDGPNHAVPAGPVPWNNDPGWTYWSAFIAKRDRVTGNFTGTTDEIIQWAACKWGIDENVIRADAYQESTWRESFSGDYENGRYHSFGIMQVRHDDSSGNLVKGGYPSTLQDTALNLDYWAAEMRACFEGAFYDGGTWLYGGTQVKGDLWGCLGYWYSGSWYTPGAVTYINQVENLVATKPWVAWGYPGK